MRISEAASKCGLSIHTIRFYEKTGLLPPIRRGTDGNRRFSAENLEWLTLLSSLRDTGMPMKQMQHFAALYEKGDETIFERKHILLEHSVHLQRQRETLDHCAKILSYKLQRYEEILGDGS